MTDTASKKEDTMTYTASMTDTAKAKIGSDSYQNSNQQDEKSATEDDSQYDNPLRDALKHGQEMALCLQIETRKNESLSQKLAESEARVEQLNSAIANAIADLKDFETSLWIDYKMASTSPSRIIKYLTKAITKPEAE